jgi:XTP/dITP diphosphohydrolase
MTLLPVVAATANPHKLREIRELVTGRLDVLPRPVDLADVVEDAPDLIGNARLKAVAVAEHTGQPALADDTGLFVDALDGAPGVHSARFAGPDASFADNVDLLLERLQGVPPEDRTARFSSVMLLAWPDGTELSARGDVEGVITDARRGPGGFGYDPVFEPSAGDGRTFAELSDEGKHMFSHRAAAIAALLDRLP